MMSSLYVMSSEGLPILLMFKYSLPYCYVEKTVIIKAFKT